MVYESPLKEFEEIEEEEIVLPEQSECKESTPSPVVEKDIVE